MSILDILRAKLKRGAKSPLPSTAIHAEMATHRAALDAADARALAAAERRRIALDMLDKDALAVADAEAADARLAAEVARHALSELQPAHAAAVEQEAADALTVRRDAIDQRLQREGAACLDRYDELARQLATTLAELRALDRDAAKVNSALVAAGRRDERITLLDTRFRFTPAHQEPDRVETVEAVEEMFGGEWGPVTALRRQPDGSMGSIYPTRPVTREVRRRGRFRPPIILPSLSDISLPPGRIGGAPHWPLEG